MVLVVVVMLVVVVVVCRWSMETAKAEDCMAADKVMPALLRVG